MAFRPVEPIALAPNAVAAGSYTVDIAALGWDIQTDDYVLIAVICNNISSTLSETSGGATVWDTTGKLNVTSGPRMWLTWGKVGAGPAISNPTFQLAAGTAIWQVSVELWRDAHATTFKNSLVTRDPGAAVTSLLATSMTPTADDCSIVYIGATLSGTANPYLRFLSDKVLAGTKQVTDISNFTCLITGSVQQKTAAETQQTMYGIYSARMGIITLAIANKAGGGLSPDGRAGVTKINWLGDFGNTHEAVTWAKLSDMVAWTGGAIEGVTVDTAALAAVTTSLQSSPYWGNSSEIKNSTNTASLYGGAYFTFAAMDMRGKLFSCEWSCPSVTAQLGARGVIAAFRDTGGNAVVFRLARKILIEAGKTYASIISLEGGVTIDTKGTIDWQFIDGIGFGYERAGSAGTIRSLLVRNLFLHATTSIVGGNAEKPVNIKLLDRILNGWGYLGQCDALGDAVLTKTKVQLGNGAFPTYIDATATLTNFPAAYDSITQHLWNVPANTVSLTLTGVAGDTVNITTATISAASQQGLVVNVTPTAAVSFAGSSFIGLLPVFDSDADIASATFSRCGVIDFKACDLTNVIVEEGTGTQVFLASDGFSATGCTFVASSTTVDGGAIAAAGTFNLEDTTFTGFTNDFNVTAPNVADSVDIILAAGQATPSYIETYAGVTDIQSDPVNQAVVLTGLSTTCRVQLYDASVSAPVGSRILYNGEPGTTSYTWTDPLAAVASRAIRLRITDYLGATAKVMIERNIGTCGTTDGTEIVSFNNEFEEDTNYNTQAAALGYNGEDILDIEIDDTTDTVKFNFLAGGDYDARRIYMYMVYWLDTEAGINDDFVFCRPLDPVNLPMEGVVFENVTAPQEIITFINAYVYDATTGRAKDLVVGDGINFAPDHVVQVIATVGGVNIITGHINEVAGKVQEGLTAQGLTETRAAKLDNLDQKVSRVLVSTIATR